MNAQESWNEIFKRVNQSEMEFENWLNENAESISIEKGHGFESGIYNKVDFGDDDIVWVKEDGSSGKSARSWKYAKQYMTIIK